jgi:polygalacturonase
LLTLTSCASSSSTHRRGAASGLAFSVREFGAVGDGKTKDTAAFQKALDACGGSLGAEVIVPPGNYLIGSIVMPSICTLRIDPGATLTASPDKEDYPLMTIRWEGKWRGGHRAMIYARNAKHIAIVGGGTIVGPSELANLRHPRGPCIFEPIDCSDVLLEGLTIRYRRMWTVHLTYCHDVTVRNVTIRSEAANGDGIDVDSCSKVKIRHCDIDTGDDAIALKSGRGTEGVRIGKPTENVEITDCKLGSAFAGLAFGTEMSGGIRNIKIRRCTFTRGSNGIYIKSRIGRGGTIENIDAQDLVGDGPRVFLNIDLITKGIQDEQPVTGLPGVPQLRNARFENIKSTCQTFLDGMLIPPDKPVENLTVKNVTGTARRAVRLSNMRGVELKDINLTGFSGPMIQINNVTGSGLEKAVTTSPATRTSPLPTTSPR